MKHLNFNENGLKSLISKRTILIILALILVAGCTTQGRVYESRTFEPIKQRTEVGYQTFTDELFTLTYSDEWIEPKHYTEDYYFFQLMDFDPYIHLSVFDIDEFSNTTDYYEIMSELFYIAFDFQEVENYVDEDTMIMRGTMIDEDDDEVMVNFKVIVCGDIALALDITGLTEEYDETKEMMSNTVESFECI